MTSAYRSSTLSAVVAGRGGHGHDLLGEHVERVARHDRALDQALAHALGDDGALEQVAAELGEDPALGDVADVVAGAPDPLQAGGHRLRRLDLEHEVDGAHVDAQLEARGGDQARQLAGLQQVLDHEPLLARERAVVGARDRLLGELVEAQREPLGAAAAVDEDQRAAVLAHELEQLRVDRRPDRLAGRLHAGALERIELDVRVGLDHRLDRHVDLEVERLAHAGVHDRAGALRADEEAADLLERVLGRAQADPLHVAARRLLEPLERERQVRPALGLRDGVDLVDDHLLDALEDLGRLTGQHQVERLGRGDQDVRRVADHVAPVLLRRVAGAQADLDVGADAPQRRAQVLLDVVGERLQRRHVDEPRAVGGRLGDEAVERPQEGGEGLARAGGRRDQRVRAGRDRRPGQRLGRRGLREGALEPLPDLGVKGESGTYQRVRADGRALARAARTLWRLDVAIRRQLARCRRIASATQPGRVVICAHVKRSTVQPATVSATSRARSASKALGERW